MPRVTLLPQRLGRRRFRPPDTDGQDGGDAALLARVAAGEADGPIGELYDRYAQRVYRLGLRLLGDRGRAEELVQETFVRLWRAAPRFDPAQGSVATFVYVLAQRVAVDQHRRAAVRPPGPMDGDGPRRRSTTSSKPPSWPSMCARRCRR